METRLRAVLGETRFPDRAAAGRELARALLAGGALAGESGPLVVVGLARGGVVVAAEVAAALGAPLDALAVRKVGHPWHPEYAIGAVAPGGIRYLRAHDGLTAAQVDGAVRKAEEQASALDARLHAAYPAPSLEGATCVLVDDGLATGATMVAAVRWARAQGAERVVVAVPVGAPETVRRLEEEADEVVCLLVPVELWAVGAWYEDFRQVDDEEVLGLLAAARRPLATAAAIGVDGVRLPADLTAPRGAAGWVVFAHGSGSSRRSPRNVLVAEELHRAGLATLLFDLLTEDEARERRNVFDVELLARRLLAATRWLGERPEARVRPVGYFGASTGAAAALLAAAELGDAIAAVVSRGGRPDLAWERLPEVKAPTLLVVGGADTVVLELNERAAQRLTCPHELVVVPGATHLFEEPGALEQVARLACSWFVARFAERAPGLRARAGS